MKGKKEQQIYIGRRTGVDVVHGKSIRRRDDGIDVFDDYWTDSSSNTSDETVQSSKSPSKRDSENNAANVTIEVPKKPLRSSLKKTNNQSYGDSSPGPLLRSKVTPKKSLQFSEEVEIATIAASKMTQTSHLLDDTENSPSKSKTFLKERRNENGLCNSEKSPPTRKSPRTLFNTSTQYSREELSDSEEISLIRKSPRALSATSTQYRREDLTDSIENPSIRKSPRALFNSSAQYRKEDLLLSTDDRNVANIPLSENLESGEKSKVRSDSEHEIESSSSKNRTYTPTSSQRKSEGKIADSTGKERSSFVGRSPRGLIRMSSLPNSMEKSSMKKSSDRRYPQHVTNSSNNLNQNESILSRHDRSPNRSEISVSHLRENNKKENNRKSSIVKSPVAIKRKMQTPNATENSLSNSLHSENRSKRISSVRSFSQPSAKSPEILHQEERISSEHNISANKSREKAPRLSKGSLIQVTNNADLSLNSPNTLDNQQSKSPHLQKRGNEVNKRNSSVVKSPQHAVESCEVPIQKDSMPIGKRTPQHAAKSSETLNRNESISSENRSPQHTAKSPEVLNQKGSISSRSNKSVNKSIENSSRALKQNMMENPDNTDTHLKATSRHSSIRRIDFSEPPKDAAGKNKPLPNNVRRSSRMRIPRLATWLNEKPKFQKTTSGEVQMVGLDKRPEDDYALRHLKKRYLGNSRIKKPKSSQKKVNRIGKTTVSDANTGETRAVNLHRPFSMCEWTLPMNSGSGFMVSKVFSSDALTFGLLDIAPHSMKDRQYSITDNIHFIVVKGTVDTIIDKTPFIFHKADTFIVPCGVAYSIHNNTSSNAVLHFCAFRLPFFNYQKKP